MKAPDYAPTHGIVEEFSRQALTREGRENQIEAICWNEDSHYPPILAKGKKSVYDYTDDIPAHVKPLYHYQLEQQREYFRAKRDSRSIFQKLATWSLFAIGFGVFGSFVALTHIWFEQPKEIQQLRNRVLVQTYGKVLELAAGTGMNIGNYPYAVSEIHMADSDATSLQRIRYRIPKTGYPLYAVYQERAEYLASFKDGEFDCVIDMFGLCHYRDPVMALRQMQRVCKPTGTIILLEHGRSRYFPVNWFLDYFADRHNVNSHGCAWNRPVVDYVKEARLIVKEKEDHHYGTTHYIVAYPELLPEATPPTPAAAPEKAGSNKK
jgi:methyltransferase OMS1